MLSVAINIVLLIAFCYIIILKDDLNKLLSWLLFGKCNSKKHHYILSITKQRSTYTHLMQIAYFIARRLIPLSWCNGIVKPALTAWHNHIASLYSHY